MKNNSKTVLFIRSSIFSVFMIFWTILGSLGCILIAIFSQYYAHKFVSFWTRFNLTMLGIICGIYYAVEGKENIPSDRNGIIFCKHQSTWETFFIPAFFGHVAIILKRELLWVPFFGWGLRALKPIAINRNDKKNAMEQIFIQGQACLEQGRWILVFPEGTRVPVGKTSKYKLGGAKLAVQTQYPLLPIAHNSGLFWARRSFIKRPGIIRVAIGPLIETVGKTAEQVNEEAKHWIETKVQEMI